MKLRINKDPGINLCIFVLVYTMFIGFPIYNFGLPVSALYLADALLICMVPLCFHRLINVIREKRLRIYCTSLLLLLLAGAISAIMYDPQILLFVWSVRNWGRGILFFLLCCAVLNKQTIDQILRFILKVYHINFFVILFQYLVMPDFYDQDALNGLFGRDVSGVNITASLLVLTISLSMFYAKKMSIKEVITFLMEINIVSVVAEMKVVFVFEIIIIVFQVAINSRFTAKQIGKVIGITALTVVLVAFGAQQLAKLYPEFAGFLSIDRLLSMIANDKGYGNWGYIDRLNFLPVVNKNFFQYDFGRILFGIGLGSAEYSSVSALCSDFFFRYGGRFRYLLFSSCILYIETGFVGLSLFVLAFFSIFFSGTKKVRKAMATGNKEALLYENIGMGAALISVMYIFYNNLHRADPAVLLAFFSAIPIAIIRENRT